MARKQTKLEKWFWRVMNEKVYCRSMELEQFDALVKKRGCSYCIIVPHELAKYRNVKHNTMCRFWFKSLKNTDEDKRMLEQSFESMMQDYEKAKKKEIEEIENEPDEEEQTI